MKIYLTTIFEKPFSEITDYEAIEAFKEGKVPKITFQYGDETLPINIIGFYLCTYTYENNYEWFRWLDMNGESQSGGTSLDIVPFIVSDELYDDNDRDIILNSPKSLLLNFDKLNVTTDMLKFIYEYLDGYELGIIGMGSDLTGFVSISNHNKTVVKKAWMYIALAMAGLSIVSILGYIWAVIHDSRSKIGILRAKGMKNYSVAMIYLIETLVICLISIAFACIGAYCLSSLPMMQGFATEGVLLTLKSTTFGVWQIISILGIGLLGSIIPIILISRKPPAALIREKNN